MSPMNVQKLVSLNLNVRGMSQSATLAIKDRCRALRAAGKEVFDFGLGQSPFPVPEPVVAGLREAAAQKDYLPVKGLPALREAVASFHQRNDGVEAHPELLLVGPGSKELMFIVQLVYYGEIILPTPCWVSYLPQARIIGRRISMIHTTYETQWKLTAERLQDSLSQVNDDRRPRLLILNYPSNPTGVSYSQDELKALAEVLRRFEVIVLSDEIYGQLHYRGQHASIARYYPEGTIISSGLSKWCGAGGWRLGTFSFPPDLDWLCHAMASVASETFTTVSAPIQHAAVHAFNGGPAIQSYLSKARRVLEALADYSVATLRRAGIAVHQPDGAFYLFPDFSPLADKLAVRGITDGRTLCSDLLERAGVAALPGAAFGRPRSCLAARLAFVDFDGAEALRAAHDVPDSQPLSESLLRTVCPRVMNGMDAIAAWAAS